MTSPKPEEGDKYLWWKQGAQDEAAARDEGLSPQARELRDCLEALAQPRTRVEQARRAEDLVLTLARIYCPQALKRKYRK